jgi:putative transposase
MTTKIEQLVPYTIYHIFNRANGNEKLFLNDNNYVYFSKKFLSNIDPIAETFCYCLMPNHFHFLVRIKHENNLISFFENKIKSNTLETLLSQQFSNFFNGYAKAFNKMNSRKGSLFMHPFKRIEVNDTSYLLKLVQYIHLNPVEGGLCAHPLAWKYSSYSDLIGQNETFLLREEVISWFGDLKNFQEMMMTDYKVV